MSSDRADDTQTSDREGALVLDESDPITVIERLPSGVFPVMMRLSLKKSTSGDTTHDELATPTYPVDVRIPKGPYIPESTIHFDNPAERPPRNAQAWRPSEFTSTLNELIDELNESPHIETDRLLFTHLCVAEIAPRYTTNDRQTGASVATAELYQDEGAITLAYFRRAAGLSASRVREALDTSMPGESRSPPHLVQLTEATAKPARSSRDTAQPAGRHKYYTESEAERLRALDATPAIWKLNRVASPTDSHRPLGPVLSNIESFLPELAATDLVQHVEFRGETRTREHFYAEEVL